MDIELKRLKYFILILIDDFKKRNIRAYEISMRTILRGSSTEVANSFHVTFFFDGGKEMELKGEERILIESPKVPTYDLMPEMGAYEIRDEAVKAIKSGKFNTMILNFANPDMVGHTGSIEATTKAVEVVDECLKDVVEAIESVGGVAIVLADHGNAEEMRNPDGTPQTAHTTNLVPVIITDKSVKVNSGALCDIAPTMLDLLNVEQPKAMTGKSLIK